MNRSIKRISINAVILVSLFCSVFTHCMLNNIKDTDTILHADYKYLSLVHGAIAWETGVIRRLYDFGQIFPKYKEDNQGRKLIENYEHPEQTSKLVRLIHVLFYRVPGSTGDADFGVTLQLASEDANVTVPLIAELIVQCGQLQELRGQFQQAVAYVQDIMSKLTQEQISALGKKTTKASLDQIIKDAQEKPWNRNAGELFISTCKSIAKNVPQVAQELEMHRQTAQKFFDLLIASTQNLRKLVKQTVVFKSKEPIDSFIFEAINECDPNNVNALYPAHTVEMVLLAFIYKKYSDHRAVLKMFYDTLNNKLDRKLLVSDLDEQWVNDSFKSVTQAQALKTIETIFAAQDITQSIEQHFAEFVYNALQIRAFPAPVGYASATYEYAQGKKTVPFSDCMDNALRNFINLYAYDAGQNKFTLEKLLATTGLTKVHPALANFLKLFGDVNKAAKLEAHDAWLHVISNIPYCNYRDMIDGITGQTTRLAADDKGKGFIVIPENEQNNTLLGWLNNNGYQVSGAGQYCYEIRASLKNIIIALDHLLQLNLFVEAGGLVKEFMRPDFIATYFPKLCTALNATGFLSTQKDAKKGEQNIDFDALDYTKTQIYTMITLAGIICEFRTYSGHGELRLVKAGGEAEGEQGLISLLQKITNFTNQPSLSLLVTNLLCKQKINFDHLKNNPEYIYINLFAAPLENTGLLQQIINELLTIGIIDFNMPIKLKISIKDLLLRLADRQPDVVQRQSIKLNILSIFVESLSNDDVTTNGIDSINSVKEAIQYAEKGITDPDLSVKNSALKLFEALFTKNQGFKKAAQAAQNGFVDNNWHMRSFALDLFKVLFIKDQGFKEAAQVAEQGIVDNDWHIRSTALNLFEALFARDQGFKEAAQAAEKGITDPDLNVRGSALTLFEDLFAKDQGFKEAEQAAQKGFTDPDSSVRNSALKLFKALFSKNQGFKEAAQVAVKRIIDRNIEVVLSALELFEQLIIRVPDETRKTIQKLLNDPNLTLHNYVRQQLGELLKK